MKGKISDINDLVTQPLKMFGALLYGPNEYRVNKNFDEIYKQLNRKNDEMLEAQQLSSNIILNQNEVFFNEINTIMLSGGIKIIKIDMLDTDKAGCLENYLNANNFSISNDAKQKIISFSGQNNKALESNLELIMLYMFEEEEKTIDSDIVDKVLLSDKPVEIQNLCNSAALGMIDDALFCFNKLESNGQQPIQVLNSLSNFFQRIHNTLIAMDSGKNLTEAMNELKPPVFFKEKDNFTRQIRLWNLQKIERALTIINEGETEIKRSPELSKTIAGNIVLRLTAAASK